MRVEMSRFGRVKVSIVPSRLLRTLPAYLCLAVLLAMLTVTSPASAHKDHRKPAVAAHTASQEDAAKSGPTEPLAAPAIEGPPATHEQMGEMMDDTATRKAMTPLERLLDWFGRTHPIIVHFPIAFFPAALFTAIVGRRRPSFGKPVQFLVVAGGIIAPIAAILGWLDAGFDVARDDGLLEVHRWLGTGVGALGLALAIWAILRPDEDRRPGMIAALLVVTIAIVVQGWFGGAMVHGIDHMNW